MGRVSHGICAWSGVSRETTWTNIVAGQVRPAIIVGVYLLGSPEKQRRGVSGSAQTDDSALSDANMLTRERPSRYTDVDQVTLRQDQESRSWAAPPGLP